MVVGALSSQGTVVAAAADVVGKEGWERRGFFDERDENLTGGAGTDRETVVREL
jgi:hypothetical protein